MEYGQCLRCKQYRLNPNSCQCRSFTAWLYEETEGEGRHIYADSAEEAAEVFCSRYDTELAEYYIIRSGKANVVVRDNLSEAIRYFGVEAYSKPVYNATEITKELI